MKYRLLPILLISIILLFQNCQPLTSIQIETIVPAKINFPGNFNKIVFINLDTDINNDSEIDTILYKIITDEMILGFTDAIQMSAGIDSSDFLYAKGFPNKEKLYKYDTLSWKYLERLSGNSNADIFVILDSLSLSMNTESYTDYYTIPTEYYKYRELSINAYWSIFDLVDKIRLDYYHYSDTLLWDATGYSKTEVNQKLPGVERSIKETSYFAAKDYASRIFPGWKLETRYYFVLGNKDFENAAKLVKENKWKEASAIWKNYVDNIDKEIASRACYNLALANEMMGKYGTAIGWAERSNSIKNKTRTRYYISILKSRKDNLEKLQEQIY